MVTLVIAHDTYAFLTRTREYVASPVVLEAVWRVQRRSVVQQVPTRILRAAVGHDGVQFRIGVVHHVQTRPVVRDFLVQPSRDVRQDDVPDGVSVPHRNRVQRQAEHIEIPFDHGGFGNVLARVSRGAQKPRHVRARLGHAVPGHNPADEHEPAVLFVLLRVRFRRVPVDVLHVRVRAKPEHVLRRNAIRRPVLRDLHEVSRHQRRFEEAARQECEPCEIFVRRVINGLRER